MPAMSLLEIQEFIEIPVFLTHFIRKMYRCSYVSVGISIQGNPDSRKGDHRSRAGPSQRRSPDAGVRCLHQAIVAEGKVRYVGLSECTADQIRRAHAIVSITALEIEWNLWCRDNEVPSTA